MGGRAPVHCLVLALALAPGAPVQAAQPAPRFELASGPLADMLLEIARAAGAIVSFDPDLVKGLTGRAVKGATNVGEAFEQALAGSRLSLLVGDSGVWTVRPQTAADLPRAAPAHVLDEVRVVAQAEAIGAEGGGAALPGTLTPHPAAPSEIPRSVSAISGRLAERQAAVDLPEALHNASGVTAIYDGTHNFVSSVRIRGLSAHGRIVDGMYQSQSETGPLEGIERIDVVKGPAETSPGLLTSGGIVSLVTKTPRFEPSKRLTLRVADDGARRGAADLTGPLDEARHSAYRLNLVWQRSMFPDPYDVARQEVYVAPAVRHRDGDNELVAGLEYFDRHPSIPRFTVVLDGKPAALSFPLWEVFDETRTETSARGYVLSDRALGAGWRWASRASVSGRQARYRMTIPETLDDEVISLFSRPLRARGRSATFANELRRSFEAGPTNSRIAVGVDWMSTRLDQCLCGEAQVGLVDPHTAQVTLPWDPWPTNDRSLYRLRSTGFYLQNHMSIWDRLHLLASVRRAFTHLKSKTGLGFFDEDTRNDFVAGSFGVSYAITDQLAVFANWTKGVNSLPEGLTASGQGLLPENLRQREAGFKLAAPDLRWQATFAAFRSDSDVVNVPDALLPELFIALPGQSIRGVEAELTGELRPGWEIVASVTSMDARSPDSFLVVPGQPERFGRLWTRFEFQRGVMRGWGASFGVTGTSGSYSEIGSDDWIPGHSRFDGGVSYRASDWSIDLTVKNLTDRRAYGASVSSLRVPIVPQRTVMLAARFDL